MLFKNISNGVEVNVSNLKMREGRIFFTVRNKPCGQKFLTRNTCLVLDEHVEDGTYLKIAEGWELARQPRQPKKAAKGNAEPQPAPATPASPAEPAPAEPTTPAPTPARQPKKAATPASPSQPTAPAEPASPAEITNEELQLLLSLKRMRGAAIDEKHVEEICRRVMAETKPASAANVVEVKILGENDAKRVENPHPLLAKVLALVANDRVTGRCPWLFGPAGSGKSTLAKQVAEALGLPFYSVSSLQQKYELEGYTDATGELVKTTFFKAATEGGVFLFDEASTTAGEVQVAFNSMLANLWYNFPKVGMIKAHKDFHVIAADNTAGRGANSTYSARFQLDASTLDRYTAISVDYTEEQDVFMAENDTELVTFIRDMRTAINAARLTYTASPRALRAIKAHQKMNVFTELEAFELGLCSSWAKADIKTLAARLNGGTKYHKLFNQIANS